MARAIVPITGFYESPAVGCSSSPKISFCYHHSRQFLPLSGLSRMFVLRGSCFGFPRARLYANENGGSSLGWSPGSAMEEARAAIMEILLEYGASEEDTRRIVSNSPQYLDRIVRSVRELDEHSLWSSWNTEMEEEREDISSLSFKRKVRYMAMSKRDGGLFPFLESLGVRHSSAMHIARYLASEKLPDLIDKVKFVKEMLFSNNGLVIGKNARRMMMHLSISPDEDIQGTLAFFEKIEARHGGLSMLDQGDAYFPLLIESFPRLLLLSVENHLKPLVDILVLNGVSLTRIRTVLLLYPPVIFYDIENDVRPRLEHLKKAGFGRDIGKVLIKYPWVLSFSVQQNHNKIIMFLTGRKVPKSSVDLAIRSWPHILGGSTYKMKSIVKQFGQLGVYARRLAPVITSSPQLLLRKPDDFLRAVSFMQQFGFDGITIGRILYRCPEIFAANVDDTLERKVRFLTDFGISRIFLPRVIRKYPELLLLDVNATLFPRMTYLIDIGLSKEEVCSMVSRFSPLLGYSIDSVFKPKLEFLQTTMLKPLKEIVEYPRYFSYSLEKRIKPRYWVLKSRHITCSLKDMLGKNNEEFAEIYMGVGRLLVPLTSLPPKADQ